MISIGENIQIARVEVRNVDKVINHLGSTVQLVSVECWRAVAFAAVLAERSMERKTNHAKTIGGELLLRLAGTHQIKEAIKKIGVKTGYNYLVFFGGREEAKAFIDKLELREVELKECPDDKLKKLFEKSALVEIL